jgi:hypothetical protein
MKKLLLTLFLVSASVFTCLAQNDQSMDMGGLGGLPIGAATHNYTFTLGFFLTYEVPAKVKGLEYVFSATYLHYEPNFFISGATEADFFPIDAGLKYYVHRFYISGAVGSSPNLDGGYKGSLIGLDTKASIGYTVQVFDLDDVDFGLAYESRYSSANTISQVFFHVAYRFDL